MGSEDQMSAPAVCHSLRRKVTAVCRLAPAPRTLCQNTVTIVGLLANTVCQSGSVLLTHRFSQQAGLYGLNFHYSRGR